MLTSRTVGAEMARAVDILSLVVLGGAAVCFAFGVNSLGEKQDLHALYWLVCGALLLKACTDMLRPKGGR